MERGEAWIAIHANAAWIVTGAGGSYCPTQLADFAFYRFKMPDPEEITELYFGAKARADFKSNIIGLAKATNPQISIYQMSHYASGNLFARAL